jgi:hypothetical protein
LPLAWPHALPRGRRYCGAILICVAFPSPLYHAQCTALPQGTFFSALRLASGAPNLAAGAVAPCPQNTFYGGGPLVGGWGKGLGNLTCTACGAGSQDTGMCMGSSITCF